MKIAAALLCLALASPAVAQQRPSAPAAPAVSDTITLTRGMPVRTSDGVVVAETAHIYGDGVYSGDKSFFTLAPLQLLRRILPREAYVEGGEVRLRMTAAQFRARSQNPPAQ